MIIGIKWEIKLYCIRCKMKWQIVQKCLVHYQNKYLEFWEQILIEREKSAEGKERECICKKRFLVICLEWTNPKFKAGLDDKWNEKRN